MPGCFTGISINSPISSLILGVPAITMSRLFRNSHILSTPRVLHTQTFFEIRAHILFRFATGSPNVGVGCFCFGGGSNNNQLGVFFQLWSPNRSGFLLEVAFNPQGKGPGGISKIEYRQWAPETSCGFRRGTSKGMVFGSSDNGGALFWKKRETTF